MAPGPTQPTSHAPNFSLGEELAHGLSHGLGIVLSIAGLAVLVAFAALRGDVWHVVSCAIYGTTLILLYVASTLYHSLPLPRAKPVLRVLDHCAIYLLIAGTYTPFALGNLRGPHGFAVLAVVWALALCGIVFKVKTTGRYRILSPLLYIAMGWCVLAVLEPLVQRVEPGGIALLVAGGVAYTSGVIFYAWRRPYHHAVWHLFVLAGSVLHFFAVLFYVIPPPVS